MKIRKPIKAALIDLSGTIHIGASPIPGALEAIRKLREKSIQIRFLTNTSKMARSNLLQELRSIGFDESLVPNDSIQTSVSAAADYVKRNGLNPFLMVEEDLVQEEFKDIVKDRPFDSVVVGLSKSTLNYEQMYQAFRILLKDKTLIAIHRAKYYKEEDGLLSLGPGGFVTCLEETAGVNAITIGKPSQAFFQAAIDNLGVDAEEVVMIGDSVHDDVNAALQAGIGHGILVRTGKFRETDEKELLDGAIARDSIVEAVDYILNQQ